MIPHECLRRTHNFPQTLDVPTLWSLRSVDITVEAWPKPVARMGRCIKAMSRANARSAKQVSEYPNTFIAGGIRRCGELTVI